MIHWNTFHRFRRVSERKQRLFRVASIGCAGCSTLVLVSAKVTRLAEGTWIRYGTNVSYEVYSRLLLYAAIRQIERVFKKWLVVCKLQCKSGSAKLYNDFYQNNAVSIVTDITIHVTSFRLNFSISKLKFNSSLQQFFCLVRWPSYSFASCTTSCRHPFSP